MATEDSASDQNKLSLNKNTSKFVGLNFLKLAKENARKKLNKTFMSQYLGKIFFKVYIFVVIRNNVFVHNIGYVNFL